MENFVPFTPVNFFQIACDCKYLEPAKQKGDFAFSPKNYQKFLLPDTSGLTGDIPFGKVAMGWNHEGIEFFVHIDQAFEKSSYPLIANGDSIEICIDTRDVKTSGYNTRFCHHFFFLPESFEGRQAGELTRFRTEDTHELCDPNDLKVKSQLKSRDYSLQIFIPAQCLNGYDPDQFDRLGLTYRINRGDGPSQHFSVSSDDYQFEQQPSLWSSVRLIR